MPPAGALGELTVFVVSSGTAPVGENVIRLDRVADPPAARLMSQDSPAPLSMSSAHRQVSGNTSMAPILVHTSSKPAS